MGNFNIMGSYSGIDMSVIEQMIEAERAKGVKFTNKKEKIEREQGAWKDVGSRLNALSKKISVLNSRSTFESRKVKSTAGDRSAVSVTAGNSAPIGNYQLSVTQLATSSRVVGGTINLSKGDLKKAPIDRELGLTESFKFRNGDGKSFEIEVKEGDSLRRITQNINAQTKESGIEANIINNRLVLTDTKMGDREISIESNTTASGLGFAGGIKEVGSRLTGAEIKDNAFNDLEGSLKITNRDGNSFTIDMSEAKNLTDVVNQINGKDGTGVTASVVEGRLVLIDLSAGTGELSVEAASSSDEADLNALAALGFADAAAVETTKITDVTIPAQTPDNPDEIDKEGAYSSKGQGSIFTIDGIKIERDTNQINDAIEGVSFTLKSAHAEGASEVISITNDTQKGVDAMKEFVDQYNSVVNFIKTQTDVGTPGESNNTVGALVGEGSIMRLQSGLRTTLMKNINGKTLGDFGVEIDRYGVVTLDEAKLNQVLQEDPTSLSRFFYQPDLDLGAAEGAEGNEGNAKKTEGMADLFKNFIDTYTTGSKSIITAKQESYDRMIKDINQQIETFNERIDKKRDRYIKQFAALDTAMMHAESQLDYLYSQIGLDRK